MVSFTLDLANLGPVELTWCKDSGVMFLNLMRDGDLRKTVSMDDLPHGPCETVNADLDNERRILGVEILLRLDDHPESV